ncbi:ATP-dependent helicase [bacterium I07]|nr:ATP-dependent helicase [bacterium I07]
MNKSIEDKQSLAIPINLAPGNRISIRNEDFLITEVRDNFGQSKIIKTEGISEIVKGRTFIFDTALEQDIQVIDPVKTRLLPDTSNTYVKTKLFLETRIRNASAISNKIEIGNKAAINPADYQFDPVLKSFRLPRPRMLIADAVGLGKTIEAGIFLAEQIKRGKGKRILVLALKSILSQFQQEIWARFAIPLVRLDSYGIQKIKAELPANKNPFEYYDKTIISIDTLKNNAKFRHYIEKSHWDIIVIDECHTVSNMSSQRGNLAQYLATKCESLILTSATPHNGSKESFANLITMIEPIAVPRSGDYQKSDVEPYYVRRFKKDIGESVQENFKDREVIQELFSLNDQENAFLEFQQNLKITALENRRGSERPKDLLFSIGLFKAFLSSPEACLETIENRIKRIETKEETESTDMEQLQEARRLLRNVIDQHADSKYKRLVETLENLDWRGKNKDTRILIFAERIKTLDKLYTQLKSHFNLQGEAIIKFDGRLSDVDQQEIIDDFGKEDSDIRVLLSSDAGSQGVNLHYYCNTLFNYDIPWSIITLEQRNGRIDRYGQKKTPFIYYLVGQSDSPHIKDDLHIIEKLSQKEDEIHRVLGDAASFLKKYDTEKEEKAVEEMLISGDATSLDQSLDDFDWMSIFGSEQETTEVVVDENPVNQRRTFYSDDFEFYKTLCEHLCHVGAVHPNHVHVDDGLIEVLSDKDLNSYLYDIPLEAKPKRGNFFKLSSDKDLVQKSIDNARKKKGEWPEFQMLYDLHPIIKVYMNKLEANIDKDVALVVKTSRIESHTCWFVFHGQIANNLGQSMVSEFFAIGLKQDGTFIQVLNFDTFIQQFVLTGRLINETVSEEDLESLKLILEDAVSNAELFYLKPKQDKLKLQLENKSDEYKRQLHEWGQTSREQLMIEFSETVMTSLMKAKKEKKARSIETILSEKSQYYQDLTSLDNYPHIKLLAVFYN